MSDAGNLKDFNKQLSRPLVSAPVIDNSQAGDRSERQEVIYKLKQRSAHTESSAPVILEGAAVVLETGSSLHRALQPGVASLKKVQEHADFKAFLGKIRLADYTQIQITDQGEIILEIAGRVQRFSSAAIRDSDLNEAFEVLIELAKLTGGAITSSNRVELLQWLKFHRYNIPKSGSEAVTLLGFLQLEYPTSPAAGNYWEMLSAPADNAALLTAAQCAQIRAVTRSYTKGKSLLDVLADAVVGGRTHPFQHVEANEVLQKIVSSSIAMSWAKAYIKDLDWYGANENEPVMDDQLPQILLTAMLLDLHPSIGAPEPRNCIMGFNLYSAEHIEQSFAAVQTMFEQHLIQHHGVSQHNVSLAAHLLLAGAVPEFLVKDLPATLLLGTAPWVDFCRAVNVVETHAPGSSRTQTYAQLLQLMKYDAVSEPQQTLNAMAAVDCMIDWALLNRIVTLDEVNACGKQALDKALNAYDRYTQEVAQIAQALSVPLPTRKAVARSILESAAPGCDYLEADVLYQKRNVGLEDAYTEPLAMSLVDLHMSGDLSSGDWDLKRSDSVYRQFPLMLARLTSAAGIFLHQFNKAYVTYTDTMAAQLKLTLSSLPRKDRTRLLHGNVTCFSLRPSVASPGIPDIVSSIISPPRDVYDLVLLENQKDKDAATGRYGVVMCTEYLGQLFCYELFTLHGQCRENPQLAELIQENNLLELPAREDFSGSRLLNVKPQPVYELPTDLECYTHAVPPGLVSSSQGVIEKLAVRPAADVSADLADKGYYESFFSGECEGLANFVLKHRPIATYEELVRECWGQTRLEKRRQDREDALDTFLNFVVPFKSCIQDLVSDDPDRRSDAVGMCVIEAGMTLLLVVGTVAKIAQIAARAGTAVVKAARMAKAGLLLLNSLANSLDGVPDLLRGGARLLNRSIQRLNNTALVNTVSDLRKLTGSTPYGGLRTVVDPDVITLGKWRQTPGSADLFNVWGVRHKEQWYALNRHGQPWGPKLEQFKPHKLWYLFKLDKLLPDSYTRRILKDALPGALGKLHNATTTLKGSSYTTDSGLAIKMLLGDDSLAARNALLTHLEDVMIDAAKITPDNFFIEKSHDGATAALDPNLYKDWFSTYGDPQKKKKFMVIFTETFNEYYRREGYSHEVVSDVLIHELFHGKPGTLDHAYSFIPDAGRADNFQRLDVSPLMNLASGNHRKPGALIPLNKSAAFDNADSFTLTTALLSQLKKDPALYRENIAVMSKALERSRGGYIGWEVLIKLNPV